MSIPRKTPSGLTKSQPEEKEEKKKLKKPLREKKIRIYNHIKEDEILGCKKLKRGEANELAEKLGIDPSDFSSKNDVCNEVRRVWFSGYISELEQKLDIPKTEIKSKEFTNREISDQLSKLSEYYASKKGTDNMYRSQAFKSASVVISTLRKPIRSIEDLEGVEKVGESTRNIIEELLNNGYIYELRIQELENKTLPEVTKESLVKELTKVLFIGEKTAEKLVEKGITSIDELIKRRNEKDLKLTDNQKKGLEYYYDLEKRIPRSEVKRLGDCFIELIEGEDPENKAIITGSYRRGKESSGDIDVILTNTVGRNTLPDIVQILRDSGLIKWVFGEGDKKIQAVMDDKFPETGGTMRKFDIRYFEPENWGSALLFSTGSDRLNVRMREKAIEKDMKLSEYGLTKYNPKTEEYDIKVPTETEEDVFKALGMKYLKPEDRNE